MSRQGLQVPDSIISSLPVTLDVGANQEILVCYGFVVQSPCQGGFPTFSSSAMIGAVQGAVPQHLFTLLDALFPIGRVL